MKKSVITTACLFLTVSGFGQIKILEAQLTPPVPPQDLVMKTIDQVEPRTAINFFNTPGFPSVAMHAIEAPGSYYLTDNLMGNTGEAGIIVTAPNVTIDLGGFSLIGSTNASPNNSPGIIVAPNTSSVVIQNGTITLWSDGIVGEGHDLIVRQVNAKGNGSHGLHAGPGAYVLDSTFHMNVDHGVLLGKAAFVRGVQANSNDMGIVVGGAGLVKDSSAYQNTNHGITLDGAGSRAESCLAAGNNNGIEIKGDRCTIVGCTSVSNRSEGIQCGTFSGTGPTGCRIEGNHLAANANSGIFCSGINNLIICNMAEGGQYAYFIVASNMVGQVVNSIDLSGTVGASGGNLGTNVGPWSNFAR